jgi:tripartite-type tricarboxylate transporter receptor subunit TctC
MNAGPNHMRANWAFYAALTAMSAIAFGPAALAQQWPAHAITVVSPFVGGTTNDLIASLVLNQVSKQLGQPFVLENRPGGDGTAGVVSVVHAAPDGYTLLLSSSAMNTAAILHKALPYDTLRDLAPVAMFGGQPSVLVAAPQTGFKTVADLVAAAKAKPGSLKFASVGLGSGSYFAGERFVVAAGLNVQHVAYPGPVEALSDLASGHADFYFVPLPTALSFVAQHKVVALAVTTPYRLADLVNVPALGEAGYPIPAYLFWCGLSAPLNTPRDIVDRLNAAIGNVLGVSALQIKFRQMGIVTTPMSPERYGKFFADDLAGLIKLGNDAHIQPLN